LGSAQEADQKTHLGIKMGLWLRHWSGSWHSWDWTPLPCHLSWWPWTSCWFLCDL